MEVDISDEKQTSIHMNNDEIEDDNDNNINNSNNNINEEGTYLYIHISNLFQLFRYCNRKPNFCEIKHKHSKRIH